jgi:hypothetical protein
VIVAEHAPAARQFRWFRFARAFVLQPLADGLVVAIGGVFRDRRHAGPVGEMAHQPHPHLIGGDIRFLDIASEVAEEPHRLGGDLDLLVVPFEAGPEFGVAPVDLVLSGWKPHWFRALVVRAFERLAQDETLWGLVKFCALH